MYISKEALKGFDSYKYSCIDTSPLSKYVMHPFWNQFVKLIPRWVAPNLLTFLGFMFLVVQYIILSIFDPYYETAFKGTFPIWIWWFSAVAQFFSHTLDGIDGKQARRTGSSSPLGELFDHGLDSWCVSFFTLNVYSVFGATEATADVLYFVYWSTLFAFFLSHWEKYNTGVLYLPWGYDLSQVTLLLVYIITALTSIDLWKGDFFGITYYFIVKSVAYAGAYGFSLPMSLYNVYVAKRDGKAKRDGFYETMLPFISFVATVILIQIWIEYSASDILHSNPRLTFYLISIIFSNILCRLVVSQMSGTRCQVVNKFVPILAIAVIVTVSLNRSDIDQYLLIGISAFLTIAHLHYGYVVVRTLADHFGIKVFSISKKSD